MGTIQFTGVLGAVHQQLVDEVCPSPSHLSSPLLLPQLPLTGHASPFITTQGYTNIQVPQAKPLSGGETLGCTAPLLPAHCTLVFVADGRFHLEAAMIRNPQVRHLLALLCRPVCITTLVVTSRVLLLVSCFPVDATPLPTATPLSNGIASHRIASHRIASHRIATHGNTGQGVPLRPLQQGAHRRGPLSNYLGPYLFFQAPI